MSLPSVSIILADKRGINEISFPYFSTKTYAVGTQKEKSR